MIIEFRTRKVIKDNRKCENCKYNVGESIIIIDNVWCDRHLKYINKNQTCSDYKFRCED